LVHVTGELDIATATHTDAIFTAASRGTHPQVVVDLRQVTFLDCAGVRPLAAASRRIHEAGGSLILLAENPMVLEVLRVNNLIPGRTASADGAVVPRHLPAYPLTVHRCDHRCRALAEET
jgi:anti-anti-sigma factor